MNRLRRATHFVLAAVLWLLVARMLVGYLTSLLWGTIGTTIGHQMTAWLIYLPVRCGVYVVSAVLVLLGWQRCTVVQGSVLVGLVMGQIAFSTLVLSGVFGKPYFMTATVEQVAGLLGLIAAVYAWHKKGSAEETGQMNG